MLITTAFAVLTFAHAIFENVLISVESLEKEEITFEAPKEELIINEEITLEMPSITKNLEDFKKSIEEEIKQIIDGVKLKDKVMVCLDTCHINDAGYDINDFDIIIKTFFNAFKFLIA